jgi:hypothetical protein
VAEARARAGRSLPALASLLVASGVFAAGVGSSRAAAVPDTARLAELRAACIVAPSVHVTSTEGVIFMVRRPALDTDGVEVTHHGGRLALIPIGGATEPGRRLRWDQIEKLDSERSRAVRGALIGFALGGGFGGILLGVNGRDLAEEGDSGVAQFAILVTIGATLLGLVLGANHPDIHRLYP